MALQAKNYPSPRPSELEEFQKQFALSQFCLEVLRTLPVEHPSRDFFINHMQDFLSSQVKTNCSCLTASTTGTIFPSSATIINTNESN